MHFSRKFFFFLISIKFQKQLLIRGGGIPTPLAFLAYPSELLLTKVPFYWSKTTFFQEQFYLILFVLNEQFLHFPEFLFEIVLTHISYLLDDEWYIMKYMLWNVHVDYENNELNRNVYDMVRSLLYHENFYKLKQGLKPKIFLSHSR